MAHFLSLEITDGIDCSTLIIRDASVWDPKIPIQNGIVEVEAPLSGCFHTFPFTASGFSIVVGCSGLDLCCQDCLPSVAQLPDGNYNIKLSVDPNLKTMVAFNYFRTCNLYNKYINAVCNTRSQKCDLRPLEYEKKLDSLRSIKELIDGAKWSAEECLSVHQGLEMYNEAISLLEQYNHTSCL